MKFEAPQIIYLALSAFGLGCAMVKKDDFLATLFATSVCLFLLWWGGFFG